MSSPTTSGSAASASASGLPDGISAPLGTISRTDQGGLIAILAAFALSLVLLSFPIRAYVRMKLGTYKTDDYAFIGASIFAVLQAATVFYEVKEGLGKSEELINPDMILPMEKALFSSDILYIVTMFLSKCATAFLFLRLTPGRGHAVAIWGTIWTSVVWAVVSIFLIAFRCHAAHPWTDFSEECTGLFARWQFVGALDIITEIFLFLISVYIVWGIQMSMKSKAIVVCAFGCRVPTIALAALRLHFLYLEINGSDTTLLSSTAVSCTQLEIGYSIMASIVPCLKPFMMPYDRQTDGPTQYHNYHYGTGPSHKLASLASNSREEGIAAMEPTEQSQTESSNRGFGAKFIGKLRPEQTSYEARVVTKPEQVLGDRKSSNDSGNSERMIIKKGVEWSVDYDRRNASPGSKEEDHYTIEEVNAHDDRHA